MRSPLLIFVLNLFVTAIIAQTKVSTATGTFVPASVTINQGESVEFTTTGIHSVREVSEATYNNNGSTSNGGFTVSTTTTKSITFNNPGTYYYVCPPHAAGGMKGTVTVVSTTGIQNEKIVSELSVSPNPTHGDAKLEFVTTKTGKVDVSVLNTIGKKIDSFSFSREFIAGKHTINLNTSDLPQGLYFVEIVSNGVRTVQRLFVLAN
jgi:plastocyanin